jgi:hypothetical protein
VSAAALLDLSEGRELVLDGTPWTVRAFQPHRGHIELVGANGAEQSTSVRALMNHRDCRQPARLDPSPSGPGRQAKTLDDLTKQQRKIIELRLAHVLEAETGYRSGDPFRPAPDEPRPQYDPERVPSVRARRLTKVAELTELRRWDPQAAKQLGLHQISVRTLERFAADIRRFGPVGCADDRWIRRRDGHRSITEPVREAIFAVRAECLHRSRVSMKTKERMIHQYVREVFGDEVAVPSSETLRLVWHEWFGPGGSRQRYARSAAAAEVNATGHHVVIHRPGQVVAMDTTPLPVLVRESVFGEPVEAHLTLALDVYTHSLVAFRLTLVSDTSMDVAMLLRDVMTPLPMRADWGEGMAWPYPGVPQSVVADLAGYDVAGLPFFRPETVTTDHGAVYKNHHLVEVQRVIGANVLPSRVLRPTDKQAVERAFAGIQSLLFELLTGYRGVDVADRGADPEADAVLTLAEMEHAIATWIVGVWQNRRFGEYAPCWDPDGEHSPNTLFAAAMAQGGFALEIPRPELYYELLPAHHVKIHGKRGVKIRRLWYDGPGLDDHRGELSARGGRHRGKWVVRSDPRDARFVFFQDPDTGQWHRLRWTGLSSDDEVPSFSDARVKDLLRAASAAGLKPRTDAELLPLLLELLGGHVPVEQWPSQINKKERKAVAREVARGDATAADRPEPIASEPMEPQADGDDGVVVELRWPDRAQHMLHAVDDERRRRREQVVVQRPAAPARLGDRLRRTSLLAPPDDDTEADER